MIHPEFPELGWLADDCVRAAVVVPPSNPTVEPELDALLGEDVILYAARLPRYRDLTLEQRNEKYVPAYADALDSLEGVDAHCAFIAMTGANYQFGVEGDREHCRELSERFGLPVRTASLAIHDALNALEINRIHLVSPYPDWLSDQMLNYWSTGGFTVVAVDNLLTEGEKFRAYEMHTDEVVAHLRRIEPEPGCALLLTGTGMVSIASIYQTSHDCRVPILSSNLCGAWWILRECQRPGSGLYQRVAPSHLAPHDLPRPVPDQP